MKRILYLISFLGLFLTLQSCDRISNLFNEDDSTGRQGVDNQQQDEIEKKEGQTAETEDKTATLEMQSQLQQNEDGIKALRDSLDNLKMKLTNLQNDITALQQQQTEIAKDKVGVKNLFIYLAIFSIVIVVLIVLLTKKITSKSSLTQKDIINDVTKKTSEKMQLQMSQHLAQINRITQELNSLKQIVYTLQSDASTIVIQQGNKAPTLDGGNRPNGPTITNKAPTPDRGERPAVKTTNGVFYMKRPSGENEWELSLKSEIQTEETFYRFEIDRRHANIAHFKFDCAISRRVLWALTTKDKTINSACMASYRGNTGQYRNTRDGEAELRGGKWVVTRKAEVIFE